MIQITQLRIGNLFLNPKKQVEKVNSFIQINGSYLINPIEDSHPIFDFNYTGYEPNQCSPILLDDSWMRKASFTVEVVETFPNSSDLIYRKGNFQLYSSRYRNEQSFYFEKKKHPNPKYRFLLSHAIDHLHDLQNFFFVMNREELTILV